MPSKLDLKGQRFGKLVVVRESDSRNGRAYWVCKCDCGNENTVMSSMLKNANTKSCGCLLAEKNRLRSKHNLRNTREYACWNQMIQRCMNKNNPGYKHYGARGITVCDEWLIFENFYKDMGQKPDPEWSLERIDNDSGYRPENCRWASRLTQCNNRRSSKRLLFRGRLMTVAEWAREVGIKQATIRARINRDGWSIEEALTRGVI